MEATSVICHGCGLVGAVNKVTATLRCSCGSKDLDLYSDTPEQRAFLVSLQASRKTFAEYMVGEEMPGTKHYPHEYPKEWPELRGWTEYEGPYPPSPNNQLNGYPHTEPTGRTTPEPDGTSGVNNLYVYDKHAPRTTPTEVEEPRVKRHEYPSTQTKTPFLGKRKSAGRPSSQELGSPEDYIKETTPGYGTGSPKRDFSWDDKSSHYPTADTRSPNMRTREHRDYSQSTGKPFEMPGAECPNCGQEPLHLKKDYKEDAWAHCENCGPLANIDKNPEIDPYNFSHDFKANPRSFRESARGSSQIGEKTGRILALAHAVRSTNPGLSTREVVLLARKTASRYAETR